MDISSMLNIDKHKNTDLRVVVNKDMTIDVILNNVSLVRLPVHEILHCCNLLKGIHIGSIRSDGSYIGIGKPNKLDDGFQWFAKDECGQKKTVDQALCARKECLQYISDKHRARREWFEESNKKPKEDEDEDDDEVPLPTLRTTSPVPGQLRAAQNKTRGALPYGQQPKGGQGILPERQKSRPVSQDASV